MPKAHGRQKRMVRRRDALELLGRGGLGRRGDAAVAHRRAHDQVEEAHGVCAWCRVLRVGGSCKMETGRLSGILKLGANGEGGGWQGGAANGLISAGCPRPLC